MKSLQNKVALVTGASSGLGRGTALKLAELGADLALLGRNLGALEEVRTQIEGLGRKAMALPTDVTDPQQVQSAVDATVAQFGRLDIVLSSAGLSMRADFEGSALEAMQRVMHVNFFGTLYATHFALPHVKRTRGSLVAISSLTGKRGIPTYAIYGASKFAIDGLYEALRIELGRDGVHVGVVSPAFVETPLRVNVLGPDGKPWAEPPPPPFRIWPVDKCVRKIVEVIVKRRRQALMPWFTGPMLWVDDLTGGRAGDRLLGWKFPKIAPPGACKEPEA